jgi:DNA-binding MarR family transcriptional regulator
MALNSSHVDIGVLGPVEKIVMLMLIKNKSMSFNEIFEKVSQVMSVTGKSYNKSNLSNTIRSLERKGFVFRERFRNGSIIKLNESINYYANGKKLNS